MLLFLLVLAAVSTQQKGPEIKCPKGISYRVVSRTEILKPDGVRCGFNDLSAPNPAIFMSEDREYSEFKDCKLVRTWHKTVDVFDHCKEI